MPWLAGHASVRGVSHIRSGAPCQDAASLWHSPDGRLTVGAVADGGGSLDRSDVGATLAASLAVSATAARLTAGGLDHATEEAFAAHWRAIITDIRATIALEARLTPGATPRDYGTTLIAFALMENRLAAAQVGDGFLVLGSGTATGAPNYQLVFPARPVEHVGEVVWITSSAWEEDFRSTLIETDADLVVASTDGLEKVAILQREQRPFPGFFTPLAQRAHLARSNAQLDALTAAVISMKGLDAKVDDDKTLIVATRGPWPTTDR